jgi:hypothetical protein
MNTSIDHLIQKLQQKVISLKKLVKISSAKIVEMDAKLETEKLKIVNRIQSQIHEESPEPKLLAKSTKNYNVEKEQIENYLEQII